ncbi:MAG: alpha/beta hydrolase [Alistipes sp.]|nr:alpha/beta hydrolase [Candidatus Alistipes equi]
MKKLLLVVSLLLLGIYTLYAENNKYGMKLKDGKIEGVARYKAIGIDAQSLPDALLPYKEKFPCLDKASLTSVVPEDIVYKRGRDGSELHILFFRAQTDNKKAPVVFQIHGGSWVHGSYSAKGTQRVLKTLAGKYGIAGVSIQYTFASVEGTLMEDTIQDCYDAVEFVTKNATKFGIDPKRIGFMGQSAGGHLAGMCALHFPSTKAFAGHYGAYDLVETLTNYAPKGSKKSERYVVYLKDWNTDYMKEVSPKYNVTRKNCKFASRIYAGTADITVPCSVGVHFVETLKKAGAKDVEMILYENVTHSISSSHKGNHMWSTTIDLFREKL